ncbi:alpha/beta hydrolase [Boseongicola aestuarii]|uniref:Carboxylesterase NlhH n=1 Tax=Boseongicola aestuarii TaxID=1470561 RepID=A0A238J472_9RHOB|nr:alpha/beta hydrolase [Boseongicola aestuarii]SMX25498.1 Carboxylesterase NlhH [Boseongicola aestuarii]
MKNVRAILVCFWALANAASADNTLVSLEEDVPFGALPQQTLDIYFPKTATSSTRVLVFFYGGGFTKGSKANIRRLGQSFASKGTIVVAPNYRLYPEVAFPEFVQDAALAISYVWRSLRDEDGRPRPIVIGGWSAGAYISALVAYDDRYLEAASGSQVVVNGFIGLAGPYQGGLCSGQSCPHIFPKETKLDWSVSRFVDPTDPPMLLVRGTHDMFVDASNLTKMAAAGEAAGIGVSTLVVRNASHEDLISELHESDSLVRTAVDAYLREVVGD